MRHIVLELEHYLLVPRRVAVIATFLISGLLHEAILSAAFRRASPWFIAGMALQLPLIWAGAALRGSRRGNLLVWASLILGQPCLEVLYCRAYAADAAAEAAAEATWAH